jgi:hypothetical protein
MTRERALTKLELTRAWVSGQPGWVDVNWRRADGSRGNIAALFRLRKAERWYIARLLIDLPTSALLRDVPLSRIETAVNADPAMRAWIEQGSDPETIERAKREAAQRPKLKRPSHRRLDDDFYRQVAQVYSAAVANGLNPAKTLAEESDTPPGTVNRWIATAREKGYLPKTTAGKALA